MGDVSFSKTHKNVKLHLRDQEEYSEYPDDFEFCIEDDFSIDIEPQHTVHIHCDIEILTKYKWRLHGGLHSNVHRPIFVQPSFDENLVIYGFIDSLYDFNPLVLSHIPDSICSLVQHYHWMISLNQEESTECTFEWQFHDQLDVNEFLNCSKGHILTTETFKLSGSEFYFECTPNGWNNEGICSVWLAVNKLDSKIQSQTVMFTVECKEIEYKAERQNTGGTFSVSTSIIMERQEFEELSRWTFECTVRIDEVVYNDYSLYDCGGLNSEDTHEYQVKASDEDEPLKSGNPSSCSEPDVDYPVDDHIQSVIDMRNHRYSRNLQSRRKKKEKRMKRNKMVYKKRDGKYNDKRIERKCENIMLILRDCCG